jgi:hypothetical protein
MKSSFLSSAIWEIPVRRRSLRVSALTVFGSLYLSDIGVPATYTFGDLREDWMDRNSELEEVEIPDFWVEHQGSESNRITETGRFWEIGEDNMMISDAFKNAGIQQHIPIPRIDLVENEEDYIVALLDDDGVESGKVVGR